MKTRANMQNMLRPNWELLLLGCLLTTHCGRGSGNLDGVWGHTFVSTQVLEQGHERPMVAGAHISLDFRTKTQCPFGNMEASAGCNYMSMNAHMEGTRLVATFALTTLIGCESEREAQDDWLRALLEAKPTLVLHGSELTLTSGGVEVHLVDERVANPDRPFVGTSWVVDSEIVGKPGDAFLDSDAIGSLDVPKEREAYIVFDANYRFHGFSGCNEFGGTYKQPAPGHLVFSDFTIAKNACEKDASNGEQTISEVLSGTAIFTVRGASFLIRNPRGHGLGTRAVP